MNKFEKAYALVNQNLNCPKNCKICEQSHMLFLPNEMEYLSKKNKIKKNNFANHHKINRKKIWVILEEEKNCPFFKFGKCIKRNARPLDCRSFPAVPYYTKEKISVKLDEICPLVKKNKISKKFVLNAKKAWQTIAPPKWWIKIYEKM